MPSLETQLNEVNKKKTGVDLNTPFSDRIYGLMADKNIQPSSQMPQSTQAFSDPFIRDTPIAKIGYETLNSFPFTDEAKMKLAELKFRGIDKSKNIDGDKTIMGRYTTRGADIYKTASKVLPDSISSWVADRLKSFDSPDVTMKQEVQNPDQIMVHEMIHKLFETSPMGDQSPEQDARAGIAWLQAWDRVKSTDPDMGPFLAAVDKHLKESYDTTDIYTVADERFSYLGEMVLKYGIDFIPKDLQPYYYGVIKGAPKPTPEQLGSNIDPNADYKVNVHGNSDSRGNFSDRIYNLLAGKSTIENPNAGIPKSAYTPEDKQTILGTLFGEVSNRTPDKQMLEAQTILNTARNRAKANGTTIIEELKKPHQYQAYGGKEYQRFVSGGATTTDKQKIEAITKVYNDLEKGILEDNISGYQYYTHKPDGRIIATKNYKP